MCVCDSGVATLGARSTECHLDSEKLAKNQEKEGKIRKNRGKKRKNREERQNREGSFSLPLLTDTAGYATGV